MNTHIIISSAIFVVWTAFPASYAEAFKAATNKTKGFRVFPCKSEAEAKDLAKILG